MKRLLLILPLLIVGCSDNDIKLTLDCEVDDRFYESVSAKRIQFIWYKSNNSLQGVDGTVTPYKFENDFEVTFERKDTRRILYNKIENSLTLMNLDDTDSRWEGLWGMMSYTCKKVK